MPDDTMDLNLDVTGSNMKETGEAITFLEGLSAAILKAKADGSIDWKDAKYMVPLAALGRDALKDSRLMISEIQKANGETQEAMLTRFISAATNLLDAILK